MNTRKPVSSFDFSVHEINLMSVSNTYSQYWKVALMHCLVEDSWNTLVQPPDVTFETKLFLRSGIVTVHGVTFIFSGDNICCLFHVWICIGSDNTKWNFSLSFLYTEKTVVMTEKACCLPMTLWHNITHYTGFTWRLVASLIDSTHRTETPETAPSQALWSFRQTKNQQPPNSCANVENAYGLLI